jgi:hypothetical protein
MCLCRPPCWINFGSNFLLSAQPLEEYLVSADATKLHGCESCGRSLSMLENPRRKFGLVAGIFDVVSGFIGHCVAANLLDQREGHINPRGNSGRRENSVRDDPRVADNLHPAVEGRKKIVRCPVRRRSAPRKQSRLREDVAALFVR